ncbi:MAG: tetratricopeptide repeat protein, partial [Gemmatimonadaceae bacterium]
VDNLRTEGRYDEAQRMLDSATSMLRATPDPRVEVTCLRSLTDLENEAGPHHKLAVPAIRRAIFIRDSIGETRDMVYVNLFGALADALDEQGRHRDALAIYDSSMAIFDRTGRGETMARAIVQHDYAVSLINLGEITRAEQMLHDVLVTLRRSDPSGDLPSQPLIHYAHAALFETHADSAAKYFALVASQAVKDHNTYWEGRGLFGLAQAQLQLGDLPGAHQTAARFDRLSAHKKTWSSDDQVTDPRILAALIAMSSGKATTAHSLVLQVLRANGYFDGQQRKTFHSALLLAAETALVLGHPEEALGYAHDAQANATLDSLTETRSAYVGEARLVGARAQLAMSDSSAARASMAKSVIELRNGAGVSHPRTREATTLLGALGVDVTHKRVLQ